VTPEDVRALARMAGLALRPGRAEALAASLEADLGLVERLRAADTGETHPLGVSPVAREAGHGDR
jgi:Asp-tRNA(Asn)/Glu-tRNA(Gln) amidotransferase C subunit